MKSVRSDFRLPHTSGRGGPFCRSPIDPNTLVALVGAGTSQEYRKKQIVYAQGAPADEVFYIRQGRIKLSVVSEHGREAVTAVLDEGCFFGHGCLAGNPIRISTASAMTDCSVLRLARKATLRALNESQEFSRIFISYLLSRNIRVEEDLVDQLSNTSEKRLARFLLLLADFGSDGEQKRAIPKISQEVLAEKIGTTRSRVSFFMNKFRKLGFIEYNGELKVRPTLLSVVLGE